MRAFSDLEKQLIIEMIKLDEKDGSLNALGNIIDSFYGKSYFLDHCYIELKDEHDVSIQIRKEALKQNDTGWVRRVYKDISKMLLTVVALFQYLDSQKLAYFVGNLNCPSLGEVCDDTDAYTKGELIDDDLKPLIYRYAQKQIFISETLRVLVANGFKTDEELRHAAEIESMGKQLIFTRIALLLSIVGLVIPIFITSEVEIKNDQIVTNLDEKTIIATKEAIKEGVRPLVEELKNSRNNLIAITDQLRQTKEDSMHSEKEMAKNIGLATKAITESVNKIVSILTESHDKQMQSTAKSGD